MDAIPNWAAIAPAMIPKQSEIFMAMPAVSLWLLATYWGPDIMQIEARWPFEKPNRNRFRKMNQSEWNNQSGEVFGAAALKIVQNKTNLASRLVLP